MSAHAEPNPNGNTAFSRIRISVPPRIEIAAPASEAAPSPEGNLCGGEVDYVFTLETAGSPQPALLPSDRICSSRLEVALMNARQSSGPILLKIVPAL